MKEISVRYIPIEECSSYISSKFLYFLHADNNCLVYDTLNTRLYKIDGGDWEFLQKDSKELNKYLRSNPQKYKLLQDNQLIYKSNFDQINYMNYKIDNIFHEKTLQLTILPTNACDFRCKYCFECHGKDYMTDDVQDRIIKYLRRQIPKFNSVYICWFGGEPLLQKNRIYTIMEAAQQIGRKCGVPVIGQITTNGYQLDLETFEALNKLNIIHYHVTIDGPESVHDSLRPHVSGKGTYKTILNNLTEIKKKSNYHHFSIMIRANTNKNTYLQYTDFLQEVAPIFDGDHRFLFFVQKINDWGGEGVKQMSEELLNNEKQLWEELIPQMNTINNNFGGMRNLSAVTSCSLKTRNSYAIYVDGSVYKCSMAIQGLSADNDYGKVGELLSNGKLDIDERKLADFSKKPQLYDKCEQCCWLPFCLVGMCPYAIARQNKIRCIIEDFGLSFYNDNLLDDFRTGQFVDLTKA